ncbi:hypothetical protein CPB85DRAFT_1292926 [Mucidula mucida]|nr:hypothetical protein CPB85DRAFT_1292926 [Mucidula mucida]
MSIFLFTNWLGSCPNVGFTRALDKDASWVAQQKKGQPGSVTRSQTRCMRSATTRSEKMHFYDRSSTTSHFPRPCIKRSAFVSGSGILELFGDALKTTTPLVTKVLLTWLTDSYTWWRLSDEQRKAGNIPQPQGVGYGNGVGVALSKFSCKVCDSSALRYSF